jgi:hypothetical protein
MRRVLPYALSLAATLGAFSVHEVNAAPAVTAAPLIAHGSSGDPIEQIYYHQGHYYPYHYHGAYYHHRRYDHGHWRYY